MSGLKQDDFRKLLATPRPSTAQSTPRAPNPPATPRAAPKKDFEFAKPQVPRKRKTGGWKEDAKPASQYRDRAKERREGVNPDYLESEQITKVLSASQQLSQAAVPGLQTESELSIEQSKYLGGDIQHTHLVKGLDYALLKKERNDLKVQDAEQTKEKEAQEYVESLHGSGPVTFNSKLAENIFNIAIKAAKEELPRRNEMFIPGRMAFLWELSSSEDGADYVGSGDIPTNVIRSKADLKNYDQLLSVSSNDLVIEKVAPIMANLRQGGRAENSATGEKKRVKRKDKERLRSEAEAKKREEEVRKMFAAEADDDDIFADAGRDYVLEAKGKTIGPLMPNMSAMELDGEDTLGANADDANADAMDVDDQSNPDGSLKTLLEKGVGMLNALQGEGAAEKLIGSGGFGPGASQDNWDETGVGPGPASGPPAAKTLTRKGRRSTLPKPVEQDLDNDLADLDDSASDPDDEGDITQMDMGAKQNKRRQLSRFDFDDEDKWKAYKDSQVHLPKAAFQFGIKADAREKKGKGGGKNRDAKFNKEMQQLDKIYSAKYGTGLMEKKGGDQGGGKKRKR
ncbi:hypothetical protein HK104_009008 [Borealophlyctis nickersoniae]|nr:hypothetical protein HK104_009008 [Borealophlyctis nickersoniae]